MNRIHKSLLFVFVLFVGLVLAREKEPISITVRAALRCLLLFSQFFCWQLADVHNSDPVKRLSALKHSLEEDESPLLRKIFAVLFPFGPAWNSILGTFYISSYVAFCRITPA